MSEIDVALTDYLLAVESCLFVALLLRGRRAGEPLRFWFIVFFAAGGVASASGGTVHGFFNDSQSSTYALLWRVTLVAVGVAALANWAIGARLLFSRRLANCVIGAAILQLAIYCAVVIFFSQDFLVAILDNLPALLFLMAAFLLKYRQQPHTGLLVSAAGLCLTLVAAGLQQAQVAVHPVYFNHNAVFHVVQAIALLIFFVGCQSLLGRDEKIEATVEQQTQQPTFPHK